MLESIAMVARRLPPSRTKSRCGRVLSWALTTLGADPIVQVRVAEGIFVLDTRSRTEATMIWNGSYDEDDIAFLRAVTPRDGTFLDIGANVGLIFIPLAHHLGAYGCAVAVEPVPVNVARLRASVARNDLACQVSIRQTALGAHGGSLALRKEGGRNTSGNAVPADDGDGLRAPMCTLDELVAALDLSRLDTVKIDVEGFEVEVLRGAASVLKRFRPIVYGEFNNTLMPARGVTFANVWEVFEPLGYGCYAFSARLELDYRATPPPELGNAVLIPEERLADVREAVSVRGR